MGSHVGRAHSAIGGGGKRQVILGSAVLSLEPGGGDVEKDGGENLWEQSPRVAFSHGNGRIILHSRKIIP